MARNAVTLTFAGDDKSLTRTFTAVGSGADKMGDKVDRSSKQTASGLAKMGTAADGATTHFRGTADVVDGLGTVLGNTALGPVAQMAMGFADVADGIGTSVLPALGKLKGGFGQLAGFMTSPAGIVTVIGVGLITALVALSQKSDDTGIKVDEFGRKVNESTGKFVVSEGHLDRFKKAVGGLGDKVSDVTRGIVLDFETTDNEIRAMLARNLNTVDDWTRDLDTLVERGFPNLAAFMAEQGVAMAPALDQILGRTDAQLKGFEQLAGEHGRISGENFGSGFVKGLDVTTSGKRGWSWLRNVPLIGDIIDQAFTGRAHGGPVSAGRPYVVGERGPELFLPSVSGSIVPNGGGGGMGGVTIHVHGPVLDGRQLGQLVATELRRNGRLGFAGA